jgi:ribosomal protein L16/L10AE
MLTALDWFTLVKDGGTIAVLVVVVYMFFNGKLVSAKTAKQQTDSAVNATRLAASKELIADIKKAVREGFIEGWYEIHRSHEDAVTNAIERAASKEPTTRSTRKKAEKT